MTKQQFSDQLRTILQFEAARNAIQQLFNNTLCPGSVPSVVDFCFSVIEDHIANIARLSGIEREVIESYIYEGPDNWIIKGEKIRIESPEMLWEVFKLR